MVTIMSQSHLKLEVTSSKSVMNQAIDSLVSVPSEIGGHFKAFVALLVVANSSQSHLKLEVTSSLFCTLFMPIWMSQSHLKLEVTSSIGKRSLRSIWDVSVPSEIGGHFKATFGANELGNVVSVPSEIGGHFKRAGAKST